jgi:purine-binding chemotaxis protein CheW
MNVILRGDDEPVSLLVDRIGEVIDLDENQFESPPETLTGSIRELVLSTVKLEGRLMLAIDANRAVDTGRVAA